MQSMTSPIHFVFGFSIKRFFVIIMYKVVNRIKVYEIDMDERSFLWKKSLKEKLIPEKAMGMMELFQSQMTW